MTNACHSSSRPVLHRPYKASIIKKITADNAALIGMVTHQAMTMLRATPQWTARTRSAEPTPMIEPDTTCVVLTGKCRNVAEKITKDEFKSAAKPLMDSILKIFVPIVEMIRHPPADVPKAMDVAQASFTHVGISIVSMYPPLNRARAMMPIAFWASLEPCEKAMRLADTSCILRNWRFKAIGEYLRTIQRMAIMTKYPVAKAMTGDKISDKMIFSIPPISKAAGPTLMHTAPITPPMSEWDELLGIR